MSVITIKEVPTNTSSFWWGSSKLFNEFLYFPYKLFKDDKMWVPPLLMDERTTLNIKKNPALEYCEYKMFLAYKDKRVVGRIVGMINNKANDIWKRKYIRFGWFDFIDDKEVAEKLLDAVESWGRSRGLNKIVGPMGFTDMDKEGMMVDGFDTICPMACYYNPAYYPKNIEQLGYKKEVDWIQYEIPANQPVPEKMSRINNLIKEKYNLKIVEGITKKELANHYGHKIFHTLNDAFSHLYGYVPLNEKQIDFYVKQYLSFVDLKLVCLVVDDKDNVVAFGISMPTLSRALQKAKGKILPFGWYHLLKALKNYDYIDLYVNGVAPQWQNKGVHSIYYAKMNENYIALDAKMAIANPQLETNQASQIWEKYDSRIAIRRRAYIKDL